MWKIKNYLSYLIYKVKNCMLLINDFVIYSFVRNYINYYFIMNNNYYLIMNIKLLKFKITFYVDLHLLSTVRKFSSIVYKFWSQVQISIPWIFTPALMFPSLFVNSIFTILNSLLQHNLMYTLATATRGRVF